MMTTWVGPPGCCAVGATEPAPYLSVAVVRDLGPIVVLQVAGDIDMASAATFRECLDELIAAGRRILVVDVERVTLFGAEALGVLAGARRRLRPLGGSVQLVCTRPLTVRVLIATGMTQALPRHASVSAAIRAIEPLAAHGQ